MNNSVIIWDLETVPDLRGYAAANDLSASTDEEVREAIPHVGDRTERQLITAFVDRIGELFRHLVTSMTLLLGLRRAPWL